MFDGILADVFYEVLNGRFWDVDFVEFSYGVFMYVSSYSNCNDNMMKGFIYVHCFVVS